MKTIRVAAAVIHRDNAVFAAARGYGEYRGWWEFPGGKVEKEETPEEGLRREIREELDTRIQVEEKIAGVEYDYPAFHLSMDCFWCSMVQGELTLKEAQEARWLTPEQFSEVSWLPADRQILDAVAEKLKSLR